MSIPKKMGCYPIKINPLTHPLTIDTSISSIIHPLIYIAKKPSWKNPTMFSQQKFPIFPRLGLKEILQENPGGSMDFMVNMVKTW